ncbi:MAG: orotidine-5'-phosphate decarboxylase [Ignavibacteriae bacterium]|nr:orotidine-5'-phosphate decarboxylase [Ignavibacteriota bacterium]
MTAQQKLKEKTSQKLHICVGLDTDIKKIPANLQKSKNAILDFNKAVIEATIHDSAAYKINFAFYETLGSKGFDIIEKTIDFIGNKVLIIADAKRGDIGNTSKKYAESVFDYFKCDSITLHPYMGYESVSPFLEYENKLSFILGLTSNKSAVDFEKQKLTNGKFLYQEVIEKIGEWNTNNNCGIVFGATNINELQENIAAFKSMPILLPGVGAQGGSLEDVVNTFYNINNQNFIVNVSRGLLYIDDSNEFQKSIEKEIKNLNQIVLKSSSGF